MRQLLLGCAAIGCALFVGLSDCSAQARYVLTPANTKITFVGTKPGGKHDGGFKEVSGAVIFVGSTLAGGRITVEIATPSLYSDTPKLTQHLLSPDFFEAKAHPKAKFVSSSIEAAKDGKHLVKGDLTLRGVTKSISFPVSTQFVDRELVINSEFAISKRAFGMTYGEGKIDDEVKIKVALKIK
jgi:polyisoprenoid-binding protein YceI